MLRTVNHITGFRLGALDGEIGHVRDFYFDDATWKIRYVVADIGHWLPGRKVLIPPAALGQINESHKLFHVQLTIDQIEKSPPLEAEKSVSREMEEEYLRYFGWPFYWMDPVFWNAPMGAVASPEVSTEKIPKPTNPTKPTNPNLRSTEEVNGYHMHALDGDIGHVEDFLLNEEDWVIHHLIVATRNWWPEKKVLIAPQSIEKVSWMESKVFVKLTRRDIKESLPYDPPMEHPYRDKVLEDAGKMPMYPP